ncbi:hypothetical protein [Bradyrhizobium sp.]|uniref:hypothetical protein n=1 Tax=Bradyrhizobium sp. TaxID=376 RepID=UPI003C787CB9
MGLDWLPGNKPKPGYETEFRTIVQTLLWDKVAKSDRARVSSGRWSRFREIFAGPAPSEAESRALRQRYDEIGISAYETLNAPRVGYDPIADDWAEQMHAARNIEKPLEVWRREMRGYYVVSLVPPCDGIPFYSNGAMADYVERFSFRGQFLKSCSPVIGNRLLESSYEVKFAPDLSRFGTDLLASADTYARTNNLKMPATSPDDCDSPEGQLHIVAAAGRWCQFWGDRGHFLEPYF